MKRTLSITILCCMYIISIAQNFSSEEFVTDDFQKKFNVYCAHINDKDYALNKLDAAEKYR